MPSPSVAIRNFCIGVCFLCGTKSERRDARLLEGDFPLREAPPAPPWSAGGAEEERGDHQVGTLPVLLARLVLACQKPGPEHSKLSLGALLSAQ